MTTRSIREGLVSLLTAADTAAETRVFDSRTNPIQIKEELPALVVRVAGIDDGNISVGVPMFRRIMRLVVDGYVSASNDEDLAADGDDLFDEVCEAIYTDTAWLTQFEKIQSQSTELGRDAEGNARRGGFSLVLTLQYMTDFEPVIEDTFDTLNIDTQFTQEYPT